MDTTSISSLIVLADQIKESAIVLENYIKKSNQPYPSLGVDGVPFSVPAHERNVLSARDIILSATHELRNLVLGPLGILMNIGANEILCLQTIYRYKIASSFPLHSSPSFETVSATCGLNVPDLRRILRYAMTCHIFHEPRPGHIAHTAVSQLLATNPLINDFVGNVCEVRFPASARAADALAKYGQSQDSNQSGFSLANNTALGLYDELAHDLERARRWHGAMQALALEVDFQFILDAFPWGEYPAPTILDIGGGSGDVSIGLSQHLPKAHFIVQDSSPAAFNSNSPPFPSTPSTIVFQTYNFLTTPQPVRGADVYYFRNIFHNWPDKNCITILRNQVLSLKPGARLLIDDFTLHEPGSVGWVQERKRRWMDVNMLVFFGSRERTLEEWRALLGEADKRFVLRGVSRARERPNVVLDVEWMGEGVREGENGG